VRAGHPESGEPPRQRLLLAGGGHSHALLLRRWAMRPELRPAATAITLVSRHGSSLYSGLLPALVAGLHPPAAGRIDLRQLCMRAGVAFVQGEISGLDPRERRLQLRDRPALAYELLSLDVGAVTVHSGTGEAAASASAPMAVKPLEPFLLWCQGLPAGGTVRIRGGGAAAVELALALRARGQHCQLLLRGQSLHLGSAVANRTGERLLQRAGIAVQRGVPDSAAADLLCTGSRAPHWLAASGLPVDATTGRLLTGPNLQACGDPAVFASGDCGLIATDPRPPSGVWAVRAAPLLAQNLERWLRDPHAALRRWRPQRRALQLLADASRLVPGAAGPVPEAMALWGPLAIGPNPWLGRWKDRIDRRFLADLQPPGLAMPSGGDGLAEPAMPPLPSGPGAEPAPGGEWAAAAAWVGTGLRPSRPAVKPDDRRSVMACRGCAAKLAAAPLTAALGRLGSEQVPTAPQDALPVGRCADGSLLLQSLDGFPAVVQDPWLNGRLTTLHACSDLWACGARVESAQALVTVPMAATALQEELLFQSLAGILSVLDPLGARLLGGHTLEGRDGAGLAVALTVQGPLQLASPWPKGPLRPGDALLLSRPLGSGVLLAAAMAGRAEAGWIDELLHNLQQGQAPLLELLAAHGCHACTDITGYGLLGHLGEMLAGGGAADGVAGPRVRLDARAIPAWPGALELLSRGIASSLAPANAASLALLRGPVRLLDSAVCSPSDTLYGGRLQAARQALLIDPQTCGPLLAALPAAEATAALQALQGAGFHQACLIADAIPSRCRSPVLAAAGQRVCGQRRATGLRPAPGNRWRQQPVPAPTGHWCDPPDPVRGAQIRCPADGRRQGDFAAKRGRRRRRPRRRQIRRRSGLDHRGWRTPGSGLVRTLRGAPRAGRTWFARCSGSAGRPIAGEGCCGQRRRSPRIRRAAQAGPSCLGCSLKPSAASRMPPIPPGQHPAGEWA
jgi:selenide,water dikinase